MTHEITLLRHGSSVANEAGLVQGQLDYPLSDAGKAQAADLAEHWIIRGRNFDVIVSSPLLRARETAEIIGASLSIPIEFDPGLMERHMGAAQGLSGDQFDLLRKNDARPSPYEPMFDSGESYWDLHRRAGDALQAVVRRQPGDYLVVSHGALLNALLRGLLGIAPYGKTRSAGFVFDNTGFARVRYEAETARWQIETLNATPHLDQRLRPA